MLEPVQKHFGFGQLWLLWPACSQNQAASYMPDPTSCICFCSVFPKKAQIILHKTNLDLIWMVWSGFGQTHLVRKHAGVQESLGLASGRTQPACYQFPTLTRLHSSTDIPDNIVQNQPRSDLVLADCVRFWPNGSSLEASQCARIIQPTSGQCFPAIPAWMQIGSIMFTGQES